MTSPYPKPKPVPEPVVTSEDHNQRSVMSHEHVRKIHGSIHKLTESQVPRRLIKVNFVPQFTIKKTKRVETTQTQNEILAKIKSGGFKQQLQQLGKNI